MGERRGEAQGRNWKTVVRCESGDYDVGVRDAVFSIGFLVIVKATSEVADRDR